MFDVLRTGIASPVVFSVQLFLFLLLPLTAEGCHRSTLRERDSGDILPTTPPPPPPTPKSMVCQPSSPPCFSRVLAGKRRIGPCGGPHDAYKYYAHSLFFFHRIDAVFVLRSFSCTSRTTYTVLHSNTTIILHTFTYQSFFSFLYSFFFI